MNEQDLHEYNKWLMEVWNPNQLNIPFAADAPKAFLKYRAKKLKVSHKKKLNDIKEGDTVKAKSDGQYINPKLINYVGLKFDRVMNKGDIGIVTEIKNFDAFGTYAEIKLEDGLYTVKQSRKEDLSDRLIIQTN